MTNFVIKRSGEYEPFHLYKIKDAIKKGFESVNQNVDPEILNIVSNKLSYKDVWAVEEIQDIIEMT